MAGAGGRVVTAACAAFGRVRASIAVTAAARIETVVSLEDERNIVHSSLERLVADSRVRRRVAFEDLSQRRRRCVEIPSKAVESVENRARNGLPVLPSER